jgi:hypothetical protein
MSQRLGFAMPLTFRTIDDHAIIWTDDAGVSHKCEGSYIHEGVRLLWTLCGRDVPENAAYLRQEGETVSCVECTKLL